MLKFKRKFRRLNVIYGASVGEKKKDFGSFVCILVPSKGGLYGTFNFVTSLRVFGFFLILVFLCVFGGVFDKFGKNGCNFG